MDSVCITVSASALYQKAKEILNDGMDYVEKSRSDLTSERAGHIMNMKRALRQAVSPVESDFYVIETVTCRGGGFCFLP